MKTNELILPSYSGATYVKFVFRDDKGLSIVWGDEDPTGTIQSIVFNIEESEKIKEFFNGNR